ncbi:hypothetical protein [Herbiconiux sp.]|jgi:hypothetical protein|uniref:hypothetical protein n=1 Tax=unclassified Herbiconiux TaxID=2618217 RepID=UPI0025C42E19|nr:hypothetical protein [Herbiconiux sp.]
MGRIEFHENKSALLFVGEAEVPTAVLFELKDGWHAKLARLHTAQAWSGPYESPEAALGAFARP